MVEPLPDNEQSVQRHDDTSTGRVTQGGRPRRSLNLGVAAVLAALIAAAAAGVMLKPPAHPAGAHSGR